MQTTVTSLPEHRTWEQAEVVRSDIEAAATPDSTLMIGPKKLRRYQAPPADTAYPLEYSYHLLGDVSGQHVLDIGCGSGMNSVLVAKHGAFVTGIDISPSLTRLATRRAELNGVGDQVRVMVTSAHDLPFARGSFDVVFGMAILHHLDLEAVSREVHRVLKRGGRAIFQEPVRNSALIKRVRALIPYRAPDVSPYERPLTDAELTDFSRGFSVTRTRVFSLPHVNLISVLPVLRDRPDPFYRLDRSLLRRFPALSTYACTRVLEIVKR
jgi:2-polyprenyl-3-methyl-5-hydroxy-6-metoxy-1,4-benzoquinol methylase